MTFLATACASASTDPRFGGGNSFSSVVSNFRAVILAEDYTVEAVISLEICLHSGPEPAFNSNFA